MRKLSKREAAKLKRDNMAVYLENSKGEVIKFSLRFSFWYFMFPTYFLILARQYSKAMVSFIFTWVPMMSYTMYKASRRDLVVYRLNHGWAPYSPIDKRILTEVMGIVMKEDILVDGEFQEDKDFEMYEYAKFNKKYQSEKKGGK